ncbi:leucyl aminopeptidase [Chloracidobacterium validum]|uniref:Probable cytosol aminopeptidase n=1 Tax=Chloracidobacterium validum TaxID=2821543 RepID=A0ABX8B870_9BACT|nr:leucyl aminopeptidase [Chloracidobacterium validum]QUW03127.1 leucyl aminopeptidase [Chloracidobacterium validum]
MTFRNRCQPFAQDTLDALIMPVFTEDVTNPGALVDLLPIAREWMPAVLGTAEMRGNPGQLLTLHASAGSVARKVVLVGLGSAGKLTTQAIRESVAAAVRSAGTQGARHFGIAPRTGALSAQAFAQAATLGAHLATLAVDSYRTEDTKLVQIETLTFLATNDDTEDYNLGIQRGTILGEAVNFARFLVNEPGNRMTPTTLAHHAQEMANEVGLRTEILNEDKMRDLGMEALLAVARGSVEEPRLITVHYKPRNGTNQETIALIGKGITFDTGGISLKPAENMEKMKYDMAGGAAVLGAMRAIGQLRPNINVIGIIPSCENMPSGKATRPGDVVRTMLGKTVEIINTDAEGRLILCDAMAYARQLGATCLVDLATLTGAIAVALGLRYAGLFSHHPKLASDLRAAAQAADERIWPLPLDEEYRELIKSDIADLKNVGGKYAGSITAAWFLREFAGDTPWAHLDIANVAWNTENKPHLPKGPTGFGVGTLVEFVLARATAQGAEASPAGN